ncbi:MAG: 2-hydroxyacid dehydrogenase [Burkholderiaceae bacterium]
MKVLFVGKVATRLADDVVRRLNMPCELATAADHEAVAALPGTDVLVSMRFDAAMAAAEPALRLLQAPGAGLDRIQQASLPAGARLANVYGHESSIAEYVLGTMIALSRSFLGVDRALREGRWQSQFAVDQPAPPLWPDLAGKTLGILGFGHIGQALAPRARGFGMQVCAIRSRAGHSPPEGVSFVGGPERIDELLGAADYLAVTLPSSPQTRNLLDAARLARLKPTAFLVNVGRSDVIDEAALYGALVNGRLGGAAIDVWWRYPRGPEPTLPSALPFHQLPNVLMTPHVSGWTENMMAARADAIAENIGRLGRGEPLLNEIAPGR